MITTFYPPFNFGGDGIFVEALSRALVARGHEVAVVHCLDAFQLKAGRTEHDTSEGTIDGVEVHRLSSPLGRLSPLLTQQTGRPLLKATRLKAILDRGFDVVNFHNISLIGGPAVLALSARGALKLYTLHEHWLLCSTHIFWKNNAIPCDRRECFMCSVRSAIPPQTWRLSSLVERSLRHVDALIAPSEFTARLHRQAALPVPIVVNPLFSRLAPTVADRGAAAPMHRYFLFVGRITASKGIRPLVEQFAAHPEFQLKVAGTGDLHASLQTQFQSCRNITFMGHVSGDQLQDLYAAAIAVVVPSLAPETFGLSVIEGLAFGVPAIVRDAGGCREIIETTGAGFVFGDFAQLPLLLARLAGDAVLRDQLSHKARAGFERYYTADRHIATYLDLIARLSRTRAKEANA